MPIAHFHVPEGSVSSKQASALLRDATEIYAEALASPLDRIRIFIHTYKPHHYAVAGVTGDEGAVSAPYFEFIVLEGRSLEIRQGLLREFTTLLADRLGVEPALIRGRCIRVLPEEWAIGGVPASEARKEHIRTMK